MTMSASVDTSNSRARLSLGLDRRCGERIIYRAELDHYFFVAAPKCSGSLGVGFGLCRGPIPQRDDAIQLGALSPCLSVYRPTRYIEHTGQLFHTARRL